MSTKGPSNRYGNTNGSKGNGIATKHINYQYAKDYNKSKLSTDFEKHSADFGVSNERDYASHAVHFANTIDRKNCDSFVDAKGSTHKYNKITNTYVVVDKKGYVVTYFKPSRGINYYHEQKGKNKKCP